MKKFEYWDKERFRGRVINLYSEKGVTVIQVADSEIICDLCNAFITDFPVAMYMRFAYCKKCEKEQKESWVRGEE